MFIGVSTRHHLCSRSQTLLERYQPVVNKPHPYHHTLCNVAANKRLMILMMEGRKVMSASKQASKQDIIIIIISEAEH
jgi:hypothetical protein